jgi:hypothetical protein
LIANKKKKRIEKDGQGEKKYSLKTYAKHVQRSAMLIPD